MLIELTVVFVEDAVDDRVAAAGDEDENLCHGVGVDERSFNAVSRPVRCARRRVILEHDQRYHLYAQLLSPRYTVH